MSDSNSPAVAAIEILLTLLTIPGNLLTIAAFVRFPSLRTITNRFIISLAVADLLVGFMMPLHLAFYVSKSFTVHYKYFCIGRFFALVLPGGACLLSLTVVAVDRYIAILHPLQYHRKMTSRTSIVLIVMLWIYAALVATLLFAFNAWGDSADMTCYFYKVVSLPFTVVLDVHFTVMSLVNIVLYVRIFQQAAMQRKKIMAECVPLPSAATLQKDTRSAKTLFFILGSYLLCWTPFFIVVTISHFYESAATPYFYMGSMFLALSNASLNPFIYCWKNTELRAAYKKVLINLFKRCHYYCSDVKSDTVITVISGSEQNVNSEQFSAC